MRAIVALFLSVIFFSTAADAKLTYSGSVSRSCLVPAAQQLLANIERQFGHVQLVSTCRPGARVRKTGKPSLHSWGGAIDFRVSPANKSHVIAWLRANHNGGIMTYRHSDHIHVDIGARFVSLAGKRVAVAKQRGKARGKVAARPARPAAQVAWVPWG